MTKVEKRFFQVLNAAGEIVTESNPKKQDFYTCYKAGYAWMMKYHPTGCVYVYTV